MRRRLGHVMPEQPRQPQGTQVLGGMVGVVQVLDRAGPNQAEAEHQQDGAGCPHVTHPFFSIHSCQESESILQDDMLSVIICSIDPVKFSRVTQMYGRLLAGNEFEIVGVHDALSMAEGYNRGLARSRGDLVIFSHDDVEFLTREFFARVQGHLLHCDLLGVAGTTRLCDAKWVTSAMPYVYGQVATPNPQAGMFDVAIWSAAARRIDRMQGMDGVFFCMRREVAQAIRFDQETFRDFHLYDLDFTFRAHLAGLRLSVATDLYIIHQSPGEASRTWPIDAARFLEKFKNSLAPKPYRSCRFTIINVQTIADVVEVMTPPHWTAY